MPVGFPSLPNALPTPLAAKPITGDIIAPPTPPARACLVLVSKILC